MKPNTIKRNSISTASSKKQKVWKKPIFEALSINNPLNFFKAGCTPHGS